MRTKIFTLTLFFCLPSLANTMDFASADNLWLNQSQARKQEILSYAPILLDYQNSIHLDEQGNCYSLPGGGITQIVVINSDGLISAVIAQVDTSKSQCFKKVYLGQKVPKPPFAPYYDKMKMGYGAN